MNEQVCTYEGHRDETLVAYLYGDLGEVERAVFEAHLAVCFACRGEVNELTALRGQLRAWTPPEPSRALTHRGRPPTSRRSGAWAALEAMPVWARVAAALLCVGVAAGLANLQIRYDGGGLSVRTGWIGTAATPAVLSPPADPEAWRSELTALAQALRAEFHAATDAPRLPGAQTPGAQEILRRVQALVDQSERRQQRELALRVGELLREVQAQRTADLVRIDRTLGYIQNGTGAEVMRQRRLLNDLAVRVTQRP